MTKSEYLLVCLIEECAEIQKAATKMLRFGNNHGSGTTTVMINQNRENIAHELEDLAGVVEMLRDDDVIRPPHTLATQAKKEKVERYMEYSRSIGCLEDR